MMKKLENGRREMPELSVIVPVYKVEKYLKRCICSILNQTFSDFELILVDDGSPDNCGKICDFYSGIDKRIKVIHKSNAGLGAARNSGLEAAQGIYVTFVDSDDWISADAFSYMIGLIKKHGADIISTSYQLSKKMGEKIRMSDQVIVMNRNEAVYKYMQIGMSRRENDYSVCGKIYKRYLFESVRFPEGQLYEDAVTNYILLQKVHKYVKSEKVCYFYFQNSASIVHSPFKEQDYRDMMLVAKQFVELSKRESGEVQLLAKQKMARTYFSMIAKIVAYGIDKNVEKYKEIEKELVRGMRKNYLLLLGSSMPVNRKILMSVFVINYKLPAFAAEYIRKRKEKYLASDN
ncbi:MAG: glycosyltransferase [Roseburia sp.]|nr:glycosyltransferase [Roseburia sp.]